MIEKIAQRFNITLLTDEQVLEINPFKNIFMLEQASAFWQDTEHANKIWIGKFESEARKEIALWHEIGHTKHPLGSDRNVPALTLELAADTWALENYDGDISREDIVEALREWIMIYINYGDIKSKREPDLEETARILGIYDQVTWMEY